MEARTRKTPLGRIENMRPSILLSILLPHMRKSTHAAQIVNERSFVNHIGVILVKNQSTRTGQCTLGPPLMSPSCSRWRQMIQERNHFGVTHLRKIPIKRPNSREIGARLQTENLVNQGLQICKSLG